MELSFLFGLNFTICFIFTACLFFYRDIKKANDNLIIKENTKYIILNNIYYFILALLQSMALVFSAIYLIRTFFFAHALSCHRIFQS